VSIILFAIASVFVVQGAGYLVHWLAHRAGSGALYRAHMAHHERLYRPEDFLSDTYREPPASESSVLGFAPYLLGLIVLGAAVLRPAQALLFAAVAVTVGWLNSALHDALHVRGHWLEPRLWFLRLRALHYQHHLDMATIRGVFSWTWDKLLGTYRDARIQPPSAPPGAIGPTALRAREGMKVEFLVAFAVVPALDYASRIELRTVFAEDAARALQACAEPGGGVLARRAVPLEGEVLALWNELGRAAFGFGQQEER
jgi:sterol desaturase/sphingolipid hydroxylase (fatty acid hydroxylase superfamily)